MADPRKTPLVLALALLAAHAVGLAGPPVPGSPPRSTAAPPKGESQAAIEREFLAMCESVRGSGDPYYGLRPVHELERLLAQPVDDPLPRAVVRARLGIELLREGRSEEAVELLAAALKTAEEGELADELRRDILRQLALANLRLGEQVNCVGHFNPERCILPWSKQALHTEPGGSQRALALYDRYAAEGGAEPVVAWLMNIAAMTLGRFPAAVPETLRVDESRLRSPADVGRFRNVALERGVRVSQPSGGAVMDDFDGDGLLDIVTSTIDPCLPMSFFRNRGDGTFEDASERSGLDKQLGGLNIVQGDYDGDGDLDLLVLRGGWMGSVGRLRNSLLRNSGDGRFTDVTRAAGLAEPAYPTQTGNWADYDNDGDLDLYVGNEADEQGRAYPSQLFRNNGDHTFTDVAAEAGVSNRRMAKSVGWGDYDNDGDPDLYVSNMGPNRLYRNDGEKGFVDVAPTLGVTEPAGRSFPGWFFDFDNDGWLDIFVAAYSAELDAVAAHYLGKTVTTDHPLLYRNLGGEGFEEISERVGLRIPCLPMGSNYGDIDNDGWLDFYLGTGTPSYESIAPNLMFRNDRGKRVQDVSYSGGFAHLQKGHGVAFGDFDGDGDQDVLEQMGGAYPGDRFPSSLYLNPGHGHAWVTLRLVGRTSNRFAVGARIKLVVAEPAGEREIHVVVGSGGSFGGSSLRQEVGLGRATTIRRLEIRWPASATTQEFVNVAINRVYEITEGVAEIRPLESVGRPADRSDSVLSHDPRTENEP